MRCWRPIHHHVQSSPYPVPTTTSLAALLHGWEQANPPMSLGSWSRSRPLNHGLAHDHDPAANGMATAMRV